MKIAAAAEAHEVNVACHNFYGHLCTMMNAHFCAAVPNLRIMEVDIDRIAWDHELFTHLPSLRGRAPGDARIGRAGAPSPSKRRCARTRRSPRTGWSAGTGRRPDGRPGRRADHRRRRLGRRGGLEPGRDAHAHPLPRAGRLDEAGGVSRATDATGRRASSATSASARTSRAARRTIRSTTPTRRSRSPTSTASAAARSCTRRISRACIPRTSGCARSTASPTTGRSTTRTLEPYYALNDRMMGVSGLAGDPAYPPKQPPLPPLPLGQVGRDAGARAERARLALVAVGQRDRHAGVRGPRARASTSATASPAARRARRPAPTSPTGRRRSARGVELRTALPGARDHGRRRRAWPTASIYYDADGVEQLPARRSRGPGLQRRRHAAAAAELGVGAVPGRARQLAAGWSART